MCWLHPLSPSAYTRRQPLTAPHAPRPGPLLPQAGAVSRSPRPRARFPPSRRQPRRPVPLPEASPCREPLQPRPPRLRAVGPEAVAVGGWRSRPPIEAGGGASGPPADRRSSRPRPICISLRLSQSGAAARLARSEGAGPPPAPAPGAPFSAVLSPPPAPRGFRPRIRRARPRSRAPPLPALLCCHRQRTKAAFSTPKIWCTSNRQSVSELVK